MKIKLPLILIILYLGFSHLSSGQSIQKLKEQAMNTSQLTLTNGDSVEVVRLIASAGGESQANPAREYWWYRAGQVKSTQGGYGGRLLDGQYTRYNRQQDLMENGSYAKGLRVGEWRTWYADGTLQQVVQWKKGLREGDFAEYNTDGSLKREGRYRKGKLHGRVRVYENGEKPIKLRYRNGELKTKAREEKQRKKLNIKPIESLKKLQDKLGLKGKKEKNAGVGAPEAVMPMPITEETNQTEESNGKKKRRFWLPFRKHAQN